MGVVENSVIGEAIKIGSNGKHSAFSLGAGSFIAHEPDDKVRNNTIMHEYGHYLQYLDWGPWKYLDIGLKDKGKDEDGGLERDADIRACLLFGGDRFSPVYGGGLSCAQIL